MAKEPVPGQVKTRLVPALGEAGAARLYAAFLDDLGERIAASASFDGIERVLAVWPPRLDARWLDRHRRRFRCVGQRGDDLGARMDALARDAFDEGCEQVVIVGSDLPTLPLDHLVQVFAALARGVAVVLGPTPDGGYYAVGLSRPVPGLFDGPMSTADVLAATLARLDAQGVNVELAPEWSDVDVPDDLARLTAALADPATAALAPRTARLLLGRAPRHRG
jgi:rSAM/selenodomain-associated transferase 1